MRVKEQKNKPDEKWFKRPVSGITHGSCRDEDAA